MIEHPIGHAISKALQNDLVRGVVLTDALIGTFARADDEDLQQNICFLYHLIGGGTGDWDVPVGGMGAVSGELERAARDAGATMLTSADVTAVRPGGVVGYRHDGREHSCNRAVGSVQCGAGRPGRPAGPDRPRQGQPEPPARGRAGQGQPAAQTPPPAAGRAVDPEAAFGGTFHINETWSQLDAAYLSAAAGSVPRRCRAKSTAIR